MSATRSRFTVGGWALAALLAGCEPTPPVARGFEGCLLFECHGKVERIHYGGALLACVDCHGGNPDDLTKEGAHPTVTASFNPSSPGASGPDGTMLARASLATLDALDPVVLKFLNPADYRVVRDTCGSTTRGGGNCHTRITETSVFSTHATLAGQLAGGLYFTGLTERDALFSVVPVDDPYPVTLDGFVDGLDRFPSASDALPYGGGPELALFAQFGQLCVECHLSRDGPTVPGKYTSSGCNACHLPTTDDARARTADPTQDVEELGHGALHRLTNLITDDQCNRCHHAHLQRGLLIKGIRERSEPDGDLLMGGINPGVPDPPNVVYWPEENYVRYEGGYNLYGKPYPFYIEDEDGTNDVDETPPDVHFEKGMACIDCHTMSELHGDDANIPERREYETRVRCETCHGAPGSVVDPLAMPFTKALSLVGGNGDNLDVFLPPAEAGGEIMELGKLDGLLHPVTQIGRRLDPAEPRFNPRTLMGCGLHAGGAEFRAALADWVAATPPEEIDVVFPGLPEGAVLEADVGERAGRVECFACHNAWTMNCYGCHMVRDDRETAYNVLTGGTEVGKVSTFAMSVVADALALGFNTRGRIAPMVGTSIFVTHFDAAGTRIVDAEPLHTADGFAGDGNSHNPVHHHTVRRFPRDCPGCHPVAAERAPFDRAALKRAVGFGTGEYVFVDGTGRRHILDRLIALDFDGDGTWDDPETATMGPAAAAGLPLAAATHKPLGLDAALLGPGPLDVETINRMLSSPVVPQRPERP